MHEGGGLTCTELKLNDREGTASRQTRLHASVMQKNKGRGKETPEGSLCRVVALLTGSWQGFTGRCQNWPSTLRGRKHLASAEQWSDSMGLSRGKQEPGSRRQQQGGQRGSAVKQVKVMAFGHPVCSFSSSMTKYQRLGKEKRFIQLTVVEVPGPSVRICSVLMRASC